MVKPGAQSFGSVMRRRRVAAGLSQEELSERSGVSVRGIGDLERDRRIAPRLATVRLLADALGVNDEGRAELLAAARPEIVNVPSEPPAPVISPALAAPRRLLVRIPVPPTRLVGRETELANIGGTLRRAEVRLLTLTGPGGVGKTRLALAVATELAPEFRDGAVFVDLAPVLDPELVPAAVAGALRVSERGGQSLDSALDAFVEDRALLLVFDNCEHVLTGMAVAARLLAASRGLKILATSRERLHFRGEREVVVEPLALPAAAIAHWPKPDWLAEATASAAARLFVERAEEARPGFVLTAATAPAVVEICRRLEGLPLAIELAAARVRQLDLSTLLTLLEQRLPALTNGPRDLPARQQTLRDAIAWSQHLLIPQEQALFQRLTVFAGGWDEAAAVEIGTRSETGSGAEGSGHVRRARTVFDDPGADTLTRLASLVDKSLVRRSDGTGGQPRFEMLEAIREFGTECLVRAGEDAAVRRAHAAVFLALAERAAPRLKTLDADQWLEHLEREHDNLRASLAWAMEQSDAELLLRFVQRLSQFWYVRSHFAEARLWLGRALDKGPDAPAELRADAFYAASMMARAQSDHAAATSLAENALALARRLGDVLRTLQALYILGGVAQFRGDHQTAAERLEEGLALARQLNDSGRIASFLNVLGDVARVEGDYAKASVLVEEGLALKRNIGDVEGSAWCLVNLGGIALDRDDLRQADALFAQALTLFRQIGNRAGIAGALTNLGSVAIRQRERTRAATLLREGLAIYAELGDAAGIAGALEEIAALATVHGRGEGAARMLGAAEAAREATGEEILPSFRARLERTLLEMRQQVDTRLEAKAWAAGRSAPLAEIVAEVLACEDDAIGR